MNGRCICRWGNVPRSLQSAFGIYLNVRSHQIFYLSWPVQRDPAGYSTGFTLARSSSTKTRLFSE